VALKRNWIWPGATVSWRFALPETAEQVAILVPNATQTRFKVIAFNTTGRPVEAEMTGWNVAPGEWRMSGGPDANADDKADQPNSTMVTLERSASTPMAFPPGQSVFEFELVKPGTAPETRADIGIGPDDVKRVDDSLSVTIHSLGAQDAPSGRLTLTDAAGRVLFSAKTPALKAPRDLQPKTATLRVPIRKGATQVRIELSQPEITRLNNVVALP
jgi:hypothetical protein